MRIIILIGLLGALGGCVGQAAVPPDGPELPVMYTAYNIWQHDQTVFCINFKTGDRIIPAGTALRGVEIEAISDGNARIIRFRIAATGETIKVRFVARWHPGETIETYRAKMFSDKNFSALTARLTDSEIEAIRRGVVVEGMSKTAVLVSYGIPPEHANTGIDSNRWVYWQNKLNRKAVCFNLEGRTVSCSGAKLLKTL